MRRNTSAISSTKLKTNVALTCLGQAKSRIKGLDKVKEELELEYFL